MILQHSKEIPGQAVKAGNKTTIQALLQGPNFAMRRFIMEPGGGMPAHTNTVEHEQFVLGGTARVAVGTEEFDVSQGDVLLIPAGVPHWYRNSGADNFEFLCIIPNQEDVIQIIEKGC